jgi:hypothetical protein
MRRNAASQASLLLDRTSERSLPFFLRSQRFAVRQSATMMVTTPTEAIAEDGNSHRQRQHEFQGYEK